MKRAFNPAPVLALPDPGIPLCACASSDFGLAVVLLLHERPLVYHAGKMAAAGCNIIITEQEQLAAFEALRVFRSYLLSDKQLTLVTDM